MEQPRWLVHAWTHVGQKEVKGRRHNAKIVSFFKDAGHPAIKNDEIAWCAAFVGACLERTGYASTRSLMARSYTRWGSQLQEARPGAIAVFKRGRDATRGHVGFCLGETPDDVYVLGGNQSDAVTVRAFPKNRLLAYRWPNAEAERSDVRTSGREEIFVEALAHVLKMEGGYTNDPVDPGGPTNKGITLKVFAKWRNERVSARTRGALIEKLKSIRPQTVQAIYKTRYWRPAQCNEMQPAMAFMHFDAAVNHGVTGAARLLQQAVGTDVDGEIGPLTRAAITRQSMERTLKRYADVRRKRYRSLPHFWRFGRGWLTRVDRTLKAALNLARVIEDVTADRARTHHHNQTGERPMGSAQKPATRQPDAKWWGESMTIWGTIITAAATVLPALSPLIGLDLTADLVQQLGQDVVKVSQAITGLMGTVMAVYGRSRANTILERRYVQLKV